jgi:hypothetical protein
MTALVGMKVRTPAKCKCGADTAIIAAGNGKHPATLTCTQCGVGRGALTQFTADWIQTVAAKFGSPEVITLRRPPIPPVEEKA